MNGGGLNSGVLSIIGDSFGVGFGGWVGVGFGVSFVLVVVLLLKLLLQLLLLLLSLAPSPLVYFLPPAKTAPICFFRVILIEITLVVEGWGWGWGWGGGTRSHHAPWEQRFKPRRRERARCGVSALACTEAPSTRMPAPCTARRLPSPAAS